MDICFRDNKHDLYLRVSRLLTFLHSLGLLPKGCINRRIEHVLGFLIQYCQLSANHVKVVASVLSLAQMFLITERHF